jgi:hypothetical protein
MMRVVRPGGAIVVEDLDCPTSKNEEGVENPVYSRFLELFSAVVLEEELGARPGQELPQLLERAGVGSVHCNESVLAISTRGQTRSPAVLVLDSIRHAIVAAQLATRNEVDRLISELDRFRTAPQCLFWLPRIIQVWGIVPTLGCGL